MTGREFADAGVIVTGGAGGIGGGAVAALLERGARVAVLDVTPSAAATVSLRCDVTDPGAVEQAVADAAEALGGVTHLVCAAGVVSEHPVTELEPREWHRVVDISLTGAFLVARSAAPHMARAGGGAIVTTSSGWATKGYPSGAHYAAAKAGVEALTKSLALELAPHGVRANSVAPGPVRTAMILDNPAFDTAGRVAAIPLGRLGEVADVVDPMLFLLGDGARWITGQVLHVNGGMLMP